MAFIGAKNLHYAKLTQDNSDGVAYDSSTRIIGLINIETNPVTNSTTLYGDNVALAVAPSMGEVTVKVETASLPIKDRAALLGHKIENGMMVSSGTDKAPYVALLYEFDIHDGNTHYVKLLKGMFKEISEKATTKKDKTEFTTPMIEGTFICREFDNNWKYETDSGAEDSDAAVIAAWYESVEPSSESGDDPGGGD